MMILIADCGSTKINWTLLNGKEKVAQIFTTGMNALLLTEEETRSTIMAPASSRTKSSNRW